MLSVFAGSVSAGFLIAIGGSVFLSCDNKTTGAVLFAVALLCICYLGYYLFTGKIGYVVDDYSGKNIASLSVGLVGNLITTFLLGMLIAYIMPALGDKAEVICLAKLQQTFLNTFIRAVFCGMLMYLAVQVYKVHKTPLGIIYCIPVFILCGFEHSVADMFYFGVSGLADVKIITFEISAVLGNTVGSCILPLLGKVGKKA